MRLNGYELIGIWPGLAPELDAQEEEAEAEAAARGEELKKLECAPMKPSQ